MTRYASLLLLSPIIVHCCIAQPRVDRIIDADWRFVRSDVPDAETMSTSDARWEHVSLPHTWNALDGQDGGNDYYRGVGWYRKRLMVDARDRGKSVFLKFDAASTTAMVYVNGKMAGMHKGSFSAFCFDVTSLVKFGESNLIAVRVTNARDTTVAPLRGDFTIFGGIYRSVHLLVLEHLSISPLDDASPGVYVKQSRIDADAAEVEITAVVRNASSAKKDAVIRSSILDHQGRVVGTARSNVTVASGAQLNGVQNIVLNKPRLWHGRRDPYLYQVAVELLDGNEVTDRVTQPLGLRYFSVDAKIGFFLNGEPYRLHGVNRHQDREGKGWAIGIKEHREDYQLIEEMGCTTVRLAHYQQARDFYDLCDRGGMVVWAELALVDEIGASAEFAENCREQLRELIKQNYNHPSIVFWSIFNELMPDGDRPLYARVVTDLNTLAKQLDPTRLIAMASRSRYGGNEYINTVTDVIGYNVYRGWYEGKPESFGAFADSLHSRFPKLNVGISEYGAGAGITQHEYPPKKPNTKGPWHPEEWQATYHEVHWKAMAERQYLWGTFVWNMFDFASDGRSEGERHGINDKGLVTYDRKVKKDAFFWYKAHWNPEPMVHITSKRFNPRPIGTTDVRVYSNCDSLSVSVNGKLLGTKASDGRTFVWRDVELVKGRNVVEATGYKNGKKIKDECTWLTPQPEGTNQHHTTENETAES